MADIMWAIKGKNFGLYNGTWRLRGDAIARHVYALDETCYKAGWRVPQLGSALNVEQMRAWERCKRRGDSAVKVEIREVNNDR